MALLTIWISGEVRPPEVYRTGRLTKALFDDDIRSKASARLAQLATATNGFLSQDLRGPLDSVSRRSRSPQTGPSPSTRAGRPLLAVMATTSVHSARRVRSLAEGENQLLRLEGGAIAPDISYLLGLRNANGSPP